MLYDSIVAAKLRGMLPHGQLVAESCQWRYSTLPRLPTCRAYPGDQRVHRIPTILSVGG